jgi:hypothetical protein
MTDDLVKRLRNWTGDGWIGDDYAVSDEAADRIERLEKQLSLINNSLEVTIKEEVTITEGVKKNWTEFCEALIAETREILGEKNDT